jgi:hypothetical protein
MNAARNKQKTAPAVWNVTAEPNDRNDTLVIRVSGPAHRHLHWVTSDGDRHCQMVSVIGGLS